MDDEERRRMRDLVHRAHEALSEVAGMQARCPADVDRFDWSADVLDELARVALQIGDAAATIAGGDEDLERHSRELATAIVRRRNDALIPLRMPRRRLRRATSTVGVDASRATS